MDYHNVQEKPRTSPGTVNLYTIDLMEPYVVENQSINSR